MPMNKTDIEYLNYTWNPLAMLCTPVSEGCSGCWHRKRARLLSFNPKISDLDRKIYAGLIGPRPIKDRLNDPLKVKKPSMIGVQFMGDLFHEDVLEWWWIEIFDVIRRCIANGGGVGHKFLILTKRPWTMKLVMEKLNWNGERLTFNKGTPFTHLCGDGVLFGVTAENQQRADDRIPILLQIPAAKYFVSHEPALGMITYPKEFLALGDRAWLITGGESGPGARPMHPDIPRHDRDQCQAAGVPFFMKQMAKRESIPSDLMIREYPNV